MEKGSERTGKAVWKIAEVYTQAARTDLRTLNNSILLIRQQLYSGAEHLV